MAVIAARTTEMIIHRTPSAVEAIIEWSVWSAFLLEDNVAFNLLSDCGAILSKKCTNSFKTHPVFQGMLDVVSVIKG